MLTNKSQKITCKQGKRVNKKLQFTGTLSK